MRPMLEALLKQYTVGGYDRDDDGWKNDIDDQPRITKGSLRKLADLGVPGLHPPVGGPSSPGSTTSHTVGTDS